MATRSGVVVNGRGVASDHLSRSSQELTGITGERLHQGSLNVVLDKPLNLDSRHAARFDHGTRYLWQARIGKRRVWLYRWKGTPYHVVEILADCRLRDALGLVNGSRVDIVIDDAMIVRLALHDRLTCFLFWGLGRRHLFYSAAYPSHRRIKSLRKRLGDGQV